MQYALVDNVRQEAWPSGKGICTACGAEMIAKCGKRIVHHWAHAYRQDCDPWWENETQWHRDWKNQFPVECREVSKLAPDGEIHRADVMTSTGIVLEFQHSAITDEERLSREQFYGNLVWVIDGKSFRQNFDIFPFYLPDPNSKIAQDVVWFRSQRGKLGTTTGAFWRLSEHPEAIGDDNPFVQIHDYDEIKNEVEKVYRGHHQYDWIRPRQTWLDATCPVYIDFGDDLLVRLELYGALKLPCVRLVSKRKFLHDASTETFAQDIASRFYLIQK